MSDSQSSSTNKALTPMMQQYASFRARLPAGTLLFFRLGDFFELFFEDAEIASRLLGLTLTQRHETPMAGVPAHALDAYVQKCLQAQYRVAICDQVEAPQTGKLVRRALTRILSPGTSLEASGLESKDNNFLLSLYIYPKKRAVACAWADIASGEFSIAHAEDLKSLVDSLYALPIKEIIIPEGAKAVWKQALGEDFQQLLGLLEKIPLAEIPVGRFDTLEGTRQVFSILGVSTLKGFGIDDNHPALGCAGALLHYATENLCHRPTHLNRITEHRPNQTLKIDPATQRGLELFRSSSGEREGSLLNALDYTVTAAGSRLLERSLACPLMDIEEIKRRQTLVGCFLKHASLSKNIQKALSKVRDIPRILSRLAHRTRNPRELGGIQQSLIQLPFILDPIESLLHTQRELSSYLNRIDRFEALSQLLQAQLVDELPSAIGEAPVIKEGVDSELDILRGLTQENDTWLKEFEEAQQQQTGIKSLKVRRHGTLGYCIEVTKANLSLVPAHYIRRQTGTNSERYTTEALREKERAVFSAKEAAFTRETALFESLVKEVLNASSHLFEAADALAELDVLLGWSQLAQEWDYCCPNIDLSQNLTIEEGRHPVVEQILKNSRMGLAGTRSFVANHLSLGGEEAHIAIITGPNMAGKSTYIRQTALIVLMAQLGAWVPAKSCSLGLVDRLFARIGASDELGKGQSTFMVEMAETAHLVHYSTSQSLVLLDEVGRGTSTYDGLSIAWALVEHLHGAKIRTLFATHYHELTQLEGVLPSLKNLCMLVHEDGEGIHFLRRVVPGAANRSYGIYVAKLAGLPPSIIERAEAVLKELEAEGRILIDLLEKMPERPKRTQAPQILLPSASPQLHLFD